MRAQHTSPSHQESLFVTAILDAGTEKLMRDHQDALHAEAGVRLQRPRHRPHISIAAYPVTARAEVFGALDRVTRETAPIDLSLVSLGVFVETETVFAQPLPSATLIDLHARIVREIGIEPLYPHHLNIGAWCPHATFTSRVGREEVVTAVAYLQGRFSRINGSIVGLGVLDQTQADPSDESVEDVRQFLFPGTVR